MWLILRLLSLLLERNTVTHPVPPAVIFSKVRSQGFKNLFTVPWQKRPKSFSFELCKEFCKISLKVGQAVHVIVSGIFLSFPIFPFATFFLSFFGGEYTTFPSLVATMATVDHENGDG